MSMTSLDGLKLALTGMLQGIERYNPDNIPTLERSVKKMENSRIFNSKFYIIQLTIVY